VMPERRSETLEEVADQLLALAHAAPAGSDSQFQLVKAFASLASTSAHQQVLSDLRSGAIVLEGLTIDTDLEWELIAGLAILGGVSAHDIDEALATDNTSNGHQAAARAKALLPTAEAKRAVFDELVNSADLPNAIVRSMTMGFDVAVDPTILEPLVDDYFAMLERVWNERTYKIAEYIIEGLYPGSLVSEELAAKTRAWLDAHTDIPALHRLVQENLAGVERALKVRELDQRA